MVDDHGGVYAALRDALRDQPGIDIVGTAVDPDGAVDLVALHEPDLVLMDVNMPGGGGAEATRRIQEHHPLTRVLALSAHGDRASVLDMLRAGAAGYVTKGAPLGELVAAIRTAVDGGRPLSAAATAEITAELSERLSWEEHAERRLRRHRAVLQASLRDGIEAVYQPIFDLASGALVGMEALARFPAHADVPVQVWFTRAQELGMGGQLELAALRTALGAAKRLPRDVYLTVNVSPSCLQEREIREALAASDLSRVVVELTEHAPVIDYDGLAQILAPLRAAGARLAVDDMGSGYSSLRHILRLAPDFIKLDIGLTSGIDQEPAKRALAMALLSFGEEIDAIVIAEGVETSSELDTLRRLGVPFGQGFRLAHPAPFPDALSRAAASGAAARRR